MLNRIQIRDAQARRWRLRLFKEHLARYCMGIGGIAVIAAIALIFIYLVKVVIPLFMPASLEARASYPAPGGHAAATLYLAMEEQNEVGLRVTADGRVLFFKVADGMPVAEYPLPLPPRTQITAFTVSDEVQGQLAFGLSNGTVLLVRHSYQSSYPDGRRVITPLLEYPLGEQPLLIDSKHRPLRQLAAQGADDQVTVTAWTEDGRLLFSHLQRGESLFDEPAPLQQQTQLLEAASIRPDFMLLDREQRSLYLANRSGEAQYFDVTDKAAPRLIETLALTDGAQLTGVRFLTGQVSLLAAESNGRISQWFKVRDEQNQSHLQKIRQFRAQRSPISALAAEYGRKGFIAADEAGKVGIYYTTSERVLKVQRLVAQPITHLAIGPRANGLLAEDRDGALHAWAIDNPHPEISMKALWGKIWYEGYQAPEYVWQSTSANSDFEPKLSFMPLAFGTLKAAFYAMLLAVPLAIMGAIYTASFMAPRMRRVVKPGIEIMEALPTVILGFLAGLWLAPVVEDNLPGIITMLIVVPLGIVAFAFVWQRLPPDVRGRVPEGWDAALLIPVVVILGWAAVASSPWLEVAFFDGSMRHWMADELGIDYDQRNALVVGLAMGFAVIPTIFSMAEDAIFSVPKHLWNGSLALGATPWQTLTRVVLLTASPGIFAAIMIGFGRAIGETMIVLMATGNTAVMDPSIFQGMRTLSANIAVEMPESEVASSHYRLLFLAALILFAFTFVFNTLGEVVRQHLRRKYSNL
ncbi:MAG: ABC transporter permease subunit [Gammaproteobacteria bacterium]|nr:ABC transporter permease subunit [Gammaproteobacteria bacterium]